jgi:hypothetical protein
MASLKEAAQLTDGIESLLDDLRSELENGEVDFDKLVTLSDEIGERADGLAETFSNVNDALMQRIQEAKGNGGSSSGGSSQTSESSQSSQGSQGSQSSRSAQGSRSSKGPQRRKSASGRSSR